jgi:hypothetical protein
MLTTRRMFFGGILGGAAATGVTVDASRSPEAMRPGDVLVLEHPGHLSVQGRRNVEESVRAIVPAGIQVVVLEEGMRARLLRPEPGCAVPLVDGRQLAREVVQHLPSEFLRMGLR